jgi:DNA-binding PadR family transcriptional regulator
MRIIEEHSMSSYEINKALTREFGVIIGPSTIYLKLGTLEKRGSIQCVEGRSGKIYSLTEQGHKIIMNVPIIVEEICNFTITILEKRVIHFKNRNG